MPTTLARRRILLLDLPRMLGDLVRDMAARDEGLEVVGDVAEEQGPEAVADTDPDLVIVGGDGAWPPASCRAAFDARPHLVVLALAGNGRQCVLWELVPRRVALGELSLETLLSSMREPRAWSWDG